jgi:hypothetical protein
MFRIFEAGRTAPLMLPILALLGTASAAGAQERASPTWQFYFTPYLWVSGLSGTTSTSNPNNPTLTSTASFGGLLSHLNSVPIIGAFEVRNGRFGLLSDLMAISLKSDLKTRDVLSSGATVRVTEVLATVMPTYRVVDGTEQALDLGIGARVVAFWTKLDFAAGQAPGFSRDTALGWAVPIAGVRYKSDIAGPWGVTLYGDVGGVRAGGNFTWQAMGLIDYQYNRWLVLHGGYRHLQIDYRGKVIHSDTALSGPLVGATIRF